MINTINDSVFGEMIYIHSWERCETQDFFGKILDVRIVAEAYEGQYITDEQRKAYQRYVRNRENFLEKVAPTLLKYYLDNYENISSNVNIPEKINRDNINEELIVKLIKVRTVYFDRKGQYGWLCDCVWDEEHGICILLSGNTLTIEDYDYLL